jgi:rhodanese-related sulfurtransferase
MMRFDARRAAGALVGVAAVYLVLSLVLGRSARSEPPPDLSANAADAGLDVWKAAAALLDPQQTVAVDVRPAEEFARYRLPGSINAPGADAARLQALAKQHPMVVVVAAKDEVAQKLVGEARARDRTGRYHYLQEGVRSWYLTFDLPVSMFSEAAAPRGYDEALGTLKWFLQSPSPQGRGRALESAQALAKMSYSPTLLKQSGKPKVAAGAKKKITGGCGG